MAPIVNPKRVRKLNDIPAGSGPVIYWMSRDQRLQDNWALLQAQELALERKQPLAVVFCLVPEFLGATLRQYRFMLQGLAEIEKGLQSLGIGFFLLVGNPEQEIVRFCRQEQIGALVGDFSPLRLAARWKAAVAKNLTAAFFEVDAHNIVPCRLASPKQEYAAYTFRPKIKRLLPEFLTDIPALKPHPHPYRQHNKRSNAGREGFNATDWKAAEDTLKVDRSVPEAPFFIPGEAAGNEMMARFIASKLHRYDRERNDPAGDGQSNLSPYLHFGQLGAQRLAYEVDKAGGVDDEASRQAFLEELVVRRELSDNFCFYNQDYDSTAGFPRWARESLEAHKTDPREYLYPLEAFEEARTHDRLWNAAQKEMMATGKMHGYMRMYWAKKILEWTASPEEAMSCAIYLNDKYSLDGRDPNGYSGIAWSIGGVHDRAWFERPVFGKIRYMSYKGSKSKFNIDNYLAKVEARVKSLNHRDK